jgi:hypothetical protein
MKEAFQLKELHILPLLQFSSYQAKTSLIVPGVVERMSVHSECSETKQQLRQCQITVHYFQEYEVTL